MYFMIYILIGMVIAGLKFNQTFKELFTEEERKALKESEGEVSQELQAKAAASFIFVLLLSILMILLYPVFIVSSLVGKLSKRKQKN
ncbi:hypothetical protein 015DV002_85 [Bacillus phage 015DV002]|nr:hypothetical protein 015DV002_85 [Bacillus phage 015DV002]